MSKSNTTCKLFNQLAAKKIVVLPKLLNASTNDPLLKELVSQLKKSKGERAWKVIGTSTDFKAFPIKDIKAEITVTGNIPWKVAMKTTFSEKKLDAIRSKVCKI